MAVPERVYSVYRDGVLLLVIRSGGPGELRRAGFRGSQEAVCSIPWAQATSFSAAAEQLAQTVIDASKGLDDFLFRLKLEGLELREGEPSYDLPYRRW